MLDCHATRCAARACVPLGPRARGGTGPKPIQSRAFMPTILEVSALFPPKFRYFDAFSFRHARRVRTVESAREHREKVNGKTPNFFFDGGSLASSCTREVERGNGKAHRAEDHASGGAR
jgi:hypothetical protein